jgi:hypothetical protein
MTTYFGDPARAAISARWAGRPTARDFPLPSARRVRRPAALSLERKPTARKKSPGAESLPDGPEG